MTHRLLERNSCDLRGHRDHHAATLAPRLDITMRVNDCVEVERSIDNGPDDPLLDQPSDPGEICC